MAGEPLKNSCGVSNQTFCNGPARVVLTRIATRCRVPSHIASCKKLIIFLSGKGSLTLDGKTCQVLPGTIRIVPASTPHAITNDHPQGLLLLSCDLPQSDQIDVPFENLFADIPPLLPEERFDTIYATEELLIERIISRGHSTPPGFWYEQKRHEWVCLLCGSARLAFDDAEPCALGPGEHIDLPAGLRHRVDWTAPNTASIWLAVHYLPTP